MSTKTSHFIERHAGGERALLVQVFFPFVTPDDALDELSELVRSANLMIVDTIVAKRDKPDSKYFVGLGKAHELQRIVKALEIEAIIINHELSAAQGRNLEQLCQCRVIDRTELILDIFAQRARTHEGKLQVELAQLQHLRTRLVRGWTHLERQKGGIGLRGPGETQLETDRRLVGVRIRNINKRLEKVMRQREQNRQSRQKNEVPTVALVGYTNAGKSTLFNRITESQVYAANKLFATLDPTLRQMHLPAIGEMILADTVGFIRDLPHDLVAAFKATLEETRQADLLLHVVDSHSTHKEAHVQQVQRVLKEISADQVPQLLVYNKIDLKQVAEPRIDYNHEGVAKRVWCSALQGLGIDLLSESIISVLAGQMRHCELVLQPDQGALRAKLYSMGVVENEAINEQGQITLCLHIKRSDYDRLRLGDK